jgi:hypothetical protein
MSGKGRCLKDKTEMQFKGVNQAIHCEQKKSPAEIYAAGEQPTTFIEP